jgi:hypothetical protein
MKPEAGPSANRVTWQRVILSGLAAGLVINAFEYGGHRVLLDDAWTAAFRALGKIPTGWTTYIPANFLVGILLVWFFARLRPRYGGGSLTALRSAAAIWLVFWVIPMMNLMPMNLFPARLPVIVIALGLVDVTLAALLGAWLCEKM